ncbi:MAG: hypothetical protein RL682_271, partial [Pseudomonadota bacterium]
MPVSQASDKSAYARLHQSFGWEVPQHFNMARVCSQRWAAKADATKKVAIYAYSTGSAGRIYTYSELQAQANRLSTMLTVL